MYLRAFREIDLNAIEYNFDLLAKRVGSAVKKCAVVKADAYGHGAVEVAKLLSGRADFFAVASMEEARELREAGIKEPLLILAYTHKSDYRELIEKDIRATVYTSEAARELSRTACEISKKAKIHIAVDTGMNRIGFKPDKESADAVKEISKLEGIEIEGIFSHFAKADFTDRSYCKDQTELFDAFIEEIEKRGVKIPIRHLYNSASILSFEDRYEMVRMGVSLYGIDPFIDGCDTELRPAMSVKCHIIHLHTVKKGEGVGYGHMFVADSDRQVATLSVGYADGYKRRLSGKGYVLINGKRAPVLGKVCMDIMMVDATGIDCRVDDEAVIIGKSGDELITADNLGKMFGSFSYEAMSTFMPRVKKIYKK